jgi:hypothetical protein
MRAPIEYRRQIRELNKVERDIFRSYQHNRIHLKRISTNRRVNKGVLPLGRKYYYAFDNVDDLGIHLEWSLEAVKEFDSLIDSGKDAVEIAKHFNRPIEDIVILALDRKIKRR